MIKLRKIRSFIMMISVVVSIVAFIILLGVFNQNINNFATDIAINNGQTSSRQAVSSLDEKLSQSVSTFKKSQESEIIISNIATIHDREEAAIDRYQATKDLKDHLFLLQKENAIIDEVFIVTNEGNYFSSVDDSTDFFEKWRNPGVFTLRNTNTNKMLFSTVELAAMFGDGNQRQGTSVPEDYLLFMGNIYNYRNKYMGTMFFTLNNEMLGQNILRSDHGMIVYDQDQIVYQGENYQGNFTGNDFRESKYLVAEDGVYFREFIPYFNIELYYQVDVLQSLSRMRIFLSIIILVVIVGSISFLFSRLASGKILNPINELLNWMRRQTLEGKGFVYEAEIQTTRFTFREKLFFYLLVGTIFPVILGGGIYYYQANKELDHYLRQNIEEEVEENRKLLNAEIAKIKTTLTLQTINMKNRMHDTEMTDLLQNISESIDRDSSLYKVESVSLYDAETDRLYFTGRDEPNFDQDSIRLESPNANFFYRIDPLKNQIYFGIKDLQQDLEKANYLFFQLPIDYFINLSTRAEFEQETILIEDRYGWQIYDSILVLNDEVDVFENYQPVKKSLALSGWEYIAYYNTELLTEESKKVYSTALNLLLVLVLILFILAFYLTEKIIEPFHRIITLLGEDEESSLNENELKMLVGVDEIDELTYLFEQNVQQLNHLLEEKVKSTNQAIQTRYEKRELQLFALQNQVNPHFLYNALDNLLFLVESGQQEPALQMINSLSQFFRFVTASEKLFITVEEELGYTKNYLDIMQIRFDNFEVQWDIDPATKGINIVKLLLQPIVENSIQHGVRNTEDLVILSITSKIKGPWLVLEVIDNATGMPRERLEEVRGKLLDPDYNKSGLYNIDNRIRMYYGVDYEFKIQSTEGFGTKVTIKLPTAIKL